ncbi:MAG: DegT/DnrJ/EryC1/StrS family aminotransferase [Candidatus Omnitrophica bacterium]|nr:DegT/DnrJ/EryC1/StrS family aminotransferase [Candidatus Omnitrophota bacterium]
MVIWKIPLFTPDFTEEDVQSAMAPIRDGWLTMGERSLNFEKTFAEQLGVRHAFAVSSGTAAIHLALACAGVAPGDEVLVPSLTFVACANTIVSLGAKPVFVDCAGENDWTFSPRDFKKKITEKTRAIMVVHYAGFPCRMEEISPVAREHGLAVVEDCAHAIFSSRNGQKCGTFGDAAAFSFFSNKNMTTGEGGMVAVEQDSYADRLRKLRSHGMTTLTLDRHKGRAISYDVVEPGYNYRIDEIRSALGLSQLKRLPDNLQRRAEIYRCYNELLGDVDEIMIPFLDRKEDEVGYHIYPILLRDPAAREALIQNMKESGVQTSIHYPAIHRFSAYRDYAEQADCPLTEKISDGELTLPFYPQMTEDDVKLVCESLKKAFKAVGNG